MVRGWKRKLASVADRGDAAPRAGRQHAHRDRRRAALPADQFSDALNGVPVRASSSRSNRFPGPSSNGWCATRCPKPGSSPPERQATYDEIAARTVAERRAREPEAPSHCAVEPFDVDFTTVGEFYHKIESGFDTIPQDVLFIGPPDAQANARYVDFNGELITVVDRDSACRAIEMIVEQGEAPTTEHPDAHFCVFDSIRVEYEQERARCDAAGIPFDPVRPVVSNPMTHFYDDAAGGNIIRDEFTPPRRRSLQRRVRHDAADAAALLFAHRRDARRSWRRSHAPPCA